MTADQHQAKAEEYLRLAEAQTGRDYEKAAMYASIATAHAALATTLRSTR